MPPRKKQKPADQTAADNVKIATQPRTRKQKLDDSHDQSAADNVVIATQPRTRGRITRSTAQSSPSLPEAVARRQSTGTFNANSSHRDEEAGKERRVMGASLMTNVLALADTLGVKKDFHVDADQLLFLDTVRVIAVVPDVAVVPARGVYEKILSGILETKSLRVAVASFRLLHDLDLRHPQVNLKSNGTGEKKEFVDNKEQVWSPFEVAAQNSENAKESTKVSMDLSMLLENIAADLDGEQTSKRRGSSGIDVVARNKDPLNRVVQYLMLRWLVSILHSDFQVRQQAFQENPEELVLIQESLILRFLMRQGNSKVKDIFSNLLRIIARLGEVDDLKGVNSKGLEMEVSRDGSESQDPGINATASEASSVSSSRGFFVTETDFAHLAATLLTMILELEDFKDLSDNKLRASRRSLLLGSLVETFMGLLDYGKTYLSPLLQMLENPQLKFKLILKYICAHAPGNIRDQLCEVSTAKQLFDCVSNTSMYKTFFPEELQILLAGAFQVFLETHTSDDELLKEVCSSFQAAVKTVNVKMACEDTHHHARCALVLADALINS